VTMITVGYVVQSLLSVEERIFHYF